MLETPFFKVEKYKEDPGRRACEICEFGIFRFCGRSFSFLPFRVAVLLGF